MKTSKLSEKCLLFCSVLVKNCTLGSSRIIYRKEYPGKRSLLCLHTGFKYYNIFQVRNDLRGYSFSYVCIKVAASISKQVISTPSRDVLNRKTKIARRCSFCGEMGHNSRTCNYTNDFKSVERTLCPRCRGSGVIPCSLCNCYDSRSRQLFDEQAVASTFELANFSKLKFIYKGKNLRQVCTKCGGSALMVCPDCFGFV
ncbi:hypothetical protein GpartN1_g4842.t1 [Galdieria partita]|uniref:CCHC-type domain-containing protein n=1 Tax=Galdieria partita TaxID=83374 RepID=A0A9C7Q036_9RHOD|nr:hypothetical protein GpartN1_g4842.t1 [Galdieria partita]